MPPKEDDVYGAAAAAAVNIDMIRARGLFEGLVCFLVDAAAWGRGITAETRAREATVFLAVDNVYLITTRRGAAVPMTRLGARDSSSRAPGHDADDAELWRFRMVC